MSETRQKHIREKSALGRLLNQAQRFAEETKAEFLQAFAGDVAIVADAIAERVDIDRRTLKNVSLILIW